jgi:hypothetical protein
LRVGPREKKEEASFSFVSKARKAKGPHGISRSRKPRISRSRKHRRRYALMMLQEKTPVTFSITFLIRARNS